MPREFEGGNWLLLGLGLEVKLGLFWPPPSKELLRGKFSDSCLCLSEFGWGCIFNTFLDKCCCWALPIFTWGCMPFQLFKLAEFPEENALLLLWETGLDPPSPIFPEKEESPKNSQLFEEGSNWSRSSIVWLSEFWNGWLMALITAIGEILFGSPRAGVCSLWLPDTSVPDWPMMDFIKLVDAEPLSSTSESHSRMIEWVDMIKLWSPLFPFS